MIPPEIADVLKALGVGMVFVYLYFAERKRNSDIQDARLKELRELEEARIRELKEHLQFVIDQLCSDEPPPPKRPPVYPPNQDVHMQ